VGKQAFRVQVREFRNGHEAVFVHAVAESVLGAACFGEEIEHGIAGAVDESDQGEAAVGGGYLERRRERDGGVLLELANALAVGKLLQLSCEGSGRRREVPWGVR